MTTRLLRVLLVATVLLAALQVAKRYMALRVALAHPDTPGLERALDWDPSNPDLHFMLARLYRDIPGLRDSDAAREHAELAAQLSPYSWRARSQLAQLYEVAGLDKQAEQAYLETIELNPLAAKDHWRLANFYLRSGAAVEAYPLIRVALASDPSLLTAGWSLLSKLGTDLEQIDAIWPLDRDARLLLLRKLVSEHRTLRDPSLHDFVCSAWDSLRETGPMPTAEESSFFLDYLLEIGYREEAQRRWIEIATANGLRDELYESQRNLVWNGRFELPLTRVALDWQVSDSEDFSARRAPGEGNLDSTALRMDFRGLENLEFAGVRQSVGVEPDTRYELFYHARSLDLTTDEGVFIEVLETRLQRRLVASEKTLGTTPWTPARLSFETPAQTRVVEIQVRRNRSRQIDSRLAGIYWLDSVSLNPSSP